MLRAALVLAFALLPLAADAQTYRCVGKDGKKYYGQTTPPQCLGLPVEQLNAQGVVVKRIDPQADAEKREAKAAEDEKKRQETAVTREQQRRDKALLATYTSEADVESSRKRALEDNRKAVQEVEARIATIKKRQAEYAKELEFYSGKTKPPAKLQEDIKNAEIDLRAQESLLEVKKKDANDINARYDEDRRRYHELVGGKKDK